MRVFISSTSEDLAPFRAAAEAVVLDLGWQPDGMEHFGTDGSLGIVEACGRRVERADLVLAIIAWRRGGVPGPERGGDGRASYTKWEIDAAFQRRKPVLVLMAAESWPGNLWEDDGAARAWVKSFRGELDRLAASFEWERVEEGAKEPLPIFRAKVRQELVRHQEKVLREEQPQGGDMSGAPAELRPRTWPQPVWPEAPYPLLLPYTHPALFAGREGELAELSRLLRLPQPILGLHAASGAGKSSLLAAGLVPALRAEGRPVAFERRPADPGIAARLAGDLLELAGGEDAITVSDEESYGFVELLVAAKRLAGELPLLVLDQFEDLMRPESARARARLGLLLAASSQRQPGREGPPCRWLLAYREDFHGKVSKWLRDVLADARALELPRAEKLPHDLSDSERFHAWPLPPLGTLPPGADRTGEAARAFLEAIETPLALITEGGEPLYPWRFAAGGAERLARAFAEARAADPEAPLVPELQVVLAHLLREAAEPRGAEVAVPERLDTVIDAALEDHLRRALAAVFVGRQGAAARAARTRVLLALRELADADGKRGDSLPADDLAAAIGDGGVEVLEALARGDTRVIAPLEEGRRYILSHDRLAEVVVRMVEEEGLHGDLDTDLLALRRFVHLNTELYRSRETEQATSLPRGRFRKIAQHREALIRGEDRERWWAATQARRRSDLRRSMGRAALAFVVLAGIGFVVWRWARDAEQRAERKELHSQLQSGDMGFAMKALDRLIADHGEGSETLRSHVEQVDLMRVFEDGMDGLEDARRGEAVMTALEAVWPLLESEFEDLRTVGQLAWTIDYLARDQALRERSERLREALLARLRRERAPPGVDAFEWSEVPEGRFQMGSREGEGSSDEQPRHEVKLAGFKILAYELTNEQYRHLVADHPGESGMPAVGISWYKAYAYAAWLGGRLPTEAEWEYAARAGTTSRYWSGDTEEDLARVGWYRARANSEGRLHEVGEKQQPNPWGLHDVHGNAWEWVADWHGKYPDETVKDPWGPPSGLFRVLRGGSYLYSAEGARAAFRYGFGPGNRFDDVGFRVVLPGPPSR